MLSILRRARIAADILRSARDNSLGFYNAAAARILAPGGSPARPIVGSSIQRILVIKLDRIGDVVLTSAFFRELRRNYPDAMITAVISAETQSLMRSCPYVNQVISLSMNSLDITGAKRLARLLRARFGAPDLTIVPRYCADLYGAGWVSFFSGAPIRLTFSESATVRKSLVNRGADGLFTHLIFPEGTRHEVERSLELLRYLGADIQEDTLEIWASEQDQRQAAALLVPLDGDRSPLIAIGPGASQAKRLWPIERYAEVCRRLHSATGARFIFMGTRSEIEMMERFKELLGHAVAVSGSTSLGAVATILRSCDLFIGSDSGQKHIAAAVGLPVVEISCYAGEGNSVPVRFHAWGVPYLIVQPLAALPPCGDTCEALEPHCILEVTVDDVEKAAMTLFLAAHADPPASIH